MKKSNIKNFVEIGPGKALTGMVKRTIKNVNCFSINSLADIKNFKDEFKNNKSFNNWCNRWNWKFFS